MKKARDWWRFDLITNYFSGLYKVWIGKGLGELCVDGIFFKLD